MQEIAHYLEKSVFSALTGFGFELDGANSSCVFFGDRLKKLIKDLCISFEGEINRIAAVKSVDKPDDLRNWSYEFLNEIFFKAMTAYRDYIWDQELIIAGKQQIKCEVALHYYLYLKEKLAIFKDERAAEFNRPPLSEKAIRKRASRMWVPYLVPIDWSRMG